MGAPMAVVVMDWSELHNRRRGHCAIGTWRMALLVWKGKHREPWSEQILAAMVKSSKKRDAGLDHTVPPPRPGVHLMADNLPSDLEGPTRGDILQAIAATHEALETKIDTLGAEFGVLKDDHRRLAERITVVKRDLRWSCPI
ncbi:hypothetical protein NDU88_003231 [Pleurodeles waltl]|uniref:Uncharacterized protein n=1 Tax=Pleurodeles waltl TaxID=8319 RepID=A0AAV7T5Y9_PLEWA|nr:hypothetical protein NDU88_003231 [Pleurodeles waltl]